MQKIVGKKTNFLSVVFCIVAVFVLHPADTQAQKVLRGRVLDATDGSGIIGANILLKGTTTGTTTDFDGDFELKIPELPATIVISSLGYESVEQRITDVAKKMTVKLGTAKVELSEVTVLGSRISEKQKESPLTVESLDVIAIKETPAANFYEGLGALKGVDVTAASLGFRIINTRGFNSTSPVRSLQIIDGVDNQAPGLNFSLGNFVGASELDVENVEIIVGASSAQYGPNAFNGVVSMNTKDPFLFQGVSAMAKVGERNLRETAVRYAKAFKLGKVDYDNLAVKLNFFYMQADDWEADNMDPTEQSTVGRNNPGGYDAVNRYGDENILPRENDRTALSQQFSRPGLGVFHRTGYEERDIVDYNTNNLKAAGAIHYKLKENITLKYGYNFGTGTTVYQGDNRYSLKDLVFQQHKVELKGEKFFVRAYNTAEDAGNSYDAVFTAFLLQGNAKTNNRWTQDYENFWIQQIRPRVRALPGYPPASFPFNFDQHNTVLSQFNDSLMLWHSLARSVADQQGLFGNFGRLEPGTEAFQDEFNRITSRTFTDSGSRFFDKSALSHVHGEYLFTPEFLDIKIGGNYRQYRPNSRGTIFADTGGRVITNWEYGVYTQLEKKLFARRLKLTASARMDKNENFDAIFSPATSAVYTVRKNHSFRASFSSGVRNPTLQDQYLYYNVGRARLLGNLNGLDSVVTVDNLFEYYNSVTLDRSVLNFFRVNPIKPERVRSIEFGYKGTLFNRLFLDGSIYHSWYYDFIGFRIVVADPPDLSPTAPPPARPTQIYRISANTPDRVRTYGASVALSYYVGKFYAITGNYSWNELNREGSTDPLIPAFNTPANKFNIGFNGRDIVSNLWGLRLRNWGFNINYKYVQGFLFEGSPQFTGFVPEFDMVDAQVNYRVPKLYTTFKLGASNLLNNARFQAYGGPRIGRMAYFSILVDLNNL
jgi:outer membrane receptor protein involved in Fe transport